VQRLAVGVPVPRGAGARREVDGVDLAAGLGARGDDVEVDDAGEPLGGTLTDGCFVWSCTVFPLC